MKIPEKSFPGKKVASRGARKQVFPSTAAPAASLPGPQPPPGWPRAPITPFLGISFLTSSQLAYHGNSVPNAATRVLFKKHLVKNKSVIPGKTPVEEHKSHPPSPSNHILLFQRHYPQLPQENDQRIITTINLAKFPRFPST